MSSNTVIVIHLESESIKFGIAGETAPRFEYSKHDFLTRHVSYHHSDARNFIIDKKLQYLDMVNIIFTEKLALKAKDCVKVVIIEDIFETKINRDILLTVLLKDMMVTEVTMQPDLFMPLLATQNLSGIVVDIGYHESRAIAIFQGRPIMHTLQVLKMGMNDVLKMFSDSIDATAADNINHPNKQSDTDQKTVRRVATEKLFKKHASYIHSNQLNKDEPTAETIAASVTVSGNPQGRVHIPTTVLDTYQSLIQNCLLLFIDGKKMNNTDNDDNEYMDRSVAEMLLDCLKACNMDIRGSVVNHIVIAGVGAAIPGISDGICDKANEILSYDENYATVAATVHSKRNRSSMSPSNSSNTGNDNSNIDVVEDNNHDDSTTAATMKMTHTLKPAQCPYTSRAHWAWVGGSLFGAVKANLAKFVRIKDISTYTITDHQVIYNTINDNDNATTHTASTTTNTISTQQQCEGNNNQQQQQEQQHTYELCEAPDWLATTGTHSHWTFFGGTTMNNKSSSSLQ